MLSCNRLLIFRFLETETRYIHQDSNTTLVLCIYISSTRSMVDFTRSWLTLCRSSFDLINMASMRSRCENIFFDCIFLWKTRSINPFPIVWLKFLDISPCCCELTSTCCRNSSHIWKRLFGQFNLKWVKQIEIVSKRITRVYISSSTFDSINRLYYVSLV